MSNTSKTNWERVDALSEADIDTSDIPAQGEEFFARSHWRLPQPAVLLEPDVAAVFTSAAAVNAALRSLITPVK